MDEKGFIFTADATLALVVVIVFTVTVVSYTMLPMYMGQDHQHLEALADSALQVMEQDGTLKQASVIVASNSTNAANDSALVLQNSLNTLIPNGIGYKMTINVGGTIVTADNKNVSGTPLYSTDIATRVRVISGPEEGWWGRAWYKSEPVEFTNKEINLTTTVWMFHNWLDNYSPWSGTGNLRTNPYWGKGTSAQAIDFAIPANATITGAIYLQGSATENWGNSFGTKTVINGQPALVVNSNQFNTPIYNRASRNNMNVYNYKGNIPVSSLHTLVNNFYVQFVTNQNYNYDMPWFSILANYTTNITIPVNVTNDIYSFQNAAGLATQSQISPYGVVYDLNNGLRIDLTTRRVITWNNMRNQNHGFDNGIPFVITGVPGVTGTGAGSAVSVVQDINLPSTTNLLDSYVVVNSWGAVDGALVEVWDNQSNTWRTVFCSFDVDGNDYSDVAGGYGNLPGIIYIGDQLRTGADNKVRITVWDDVLSDDYDLVGLQNCFTVVSTSPYKVKWDTYPFDSHQANDDIEVQTQSFTLTSDSQKAMLFFGVGLNTRNIEVRYSGTSQILYSGPITFSVDLAKLDAQKGFHRITTDNSTAGNYTLRPGNYALQVTATGPTNAWESGDTTTGNTGAASIFSGTRIAVINPQIQNEWSAGMGSSPQVAMQNATDILQANYYSKHGHYLDSSAIHTSALFAGNTPNAVTVRLELWKQ